MYLNFNDCKNGDKFYDENGKELELVKLQEDFSKLTFTIDYEVIDGKIKRVCYIHYPCDIVE